jgi:hypothetical protein
LPGRAAPTLVRYSIIAEAPKHRLELQIFLAKAYCQKSFQPPVLLLQASEIVELRVDLRKARGPIARLWDAIFLAGGALFGRRRTLI